MSITYSSYSSQLANIMVVPTTDPNFTTFLPGAIDYAEGRLYRDLDLLNTSIIDVSGVCSSGVQSVTLSTLQGTLLVVERVNLYTPAGTTSSNTTRQPLVFTTPEFIEAVYPSPLSSNCGLPNYFARPNDMTVVFGPAPDQSYGVEVWATYRPPPLSAANSSTWLCQNVPELMIAASMVFAAGYMRDFGAQSDQPQMAMSWEQQYQALMKSAQTDELRKKFQSAAWSHDQPSPIASPPRV